MDAGIWHLSQSERVIAMFWVVASTIAAMGMAVTMIFVRLKASRKPSSARKIILPPLFMSTGALMFVFPVFHIAWIQALEAFAVGMVFSVLLIKSSKFERRGEQIYLVPSRWFPFILIGLLILRIVLKLIVGSSISVGETSGMFFLMALGMILTWRVIMLQQYLRLKKYNAPSIS